jgi:hypothetical protein
MKINLLFIIYIVLLHFIKPGIFAQTADITQLSDQFTEQTSIFLTGVYNSSAAWGDYDNDGDLDILLTGNTGSGPISKVYRNNGNNTFTEQTSISLIGVSESSVAWGDYDNDGNLDILLSGYNSGMVRVSKIYKNNGDNTFTEKASIYLPGVWAGSVAWGDCDNDGDLDILLTGESGDDIISKIYYNNRDRTFTALTSLIQNGVYYSSAAWGDYDNDGDLDVLLSGANRYTPLSKIFRNNGDSTFTEQTAISFINTAGSSAAWGDYNNDGYLDIVLTGSIYSGSSVSKIYRNNGDNSFAEQTSIILTGVSYGSSSWGDYDNDGDLDLLLSGYTGSNSITKIYRNNGDNTFTEQSSISLTGVSNSATAWGDYDNDGDLDLLLTGYSNGGGISKLYRNNNSISNTLPYVPTNLNAVVKGRDVTFSWNKSTDTQTPQKGLRYNLVIGSSPNAVNTMSPMSNRNNGFRKIIGLGNINHDTTWTIKALTPGTYYWSVQAIDNCFAGSNFAAEQSFIVRGVTLIIEGLYDLWTNHLSMRDTLNAYLRNTSSPYSIVDSTKAVLDSLVFVCALNFTHAATGTYYLVIKHRNSIETWSKEGGLPFTEGTSIIYDFTNDSSKAFGNNMKKVAGKWCIYSGDVTQNYFIEFDDLLQVYNFYLLAIEEPGYYTEDVTGNGYVEYDDLVLVYNNYRAEVYSQNPLNPVLNIKSIKVREILNK